MDAITFIETEIHTCSVSSIAKSHVCGLQPLALLFPSIVKDKLLQTTPQSRNKRKRHERRRSLFHKAAACKYIEKTQVVHNIRERDSVLYLGMAKEISNLPYLCTSRKMAKEATKAQTKHADRMTLTSSSQKPSKTYLRVRRSRETSRCQIPISSSSFFLLLLLT